MDPSLADGERTPASAGFLARVPAGVQWAAVLAVPLVVLVSGLRSLSPEDRVRSEWKGTVSQVLDGDTLVVADRYTLRRLRLAHVDCPERVQPYGDRATARVRELVGGKAVRVTVHGRDKYGREVAEVELPDGRGLSDVLLEEGFAWFNYRYSSRTDLAPLEAAARGARRGLWKDRDRVPPWIFRHQNM